MAFLNALFTAALDNNLVFCQLVGMVSVVLVAQRPQDAFRFGGMLWAAVFAAGLVGWPLCVGYADAWGIPYAASTVCLLVSTAVAFVAGTVASRGADPETRARNLRVSALVACNAALLAVPLGNASASDTMTFEAALGTSFGAGLGVFLAVVLFAFIHDHIDERLVPKAMRGLPIALVTASIMALAFTGVAGIAGGLFV